MRVCFIFTAPLETRSVLATHWPPGIWRCRIRFGPICKYLVSARRRKASAEYAECSMGVVALLAEERHLSLAFSTKVCGNICRHTEAAGPGISRLSISPLGLQTSP